jgi:alpha-beta hydrolase superfamily lysophospholipase
LKPRVGVSFKERLAILLAFLTNRRKRFPIPLSDPALFTSNPDKRTFIAEDPLSIREGTASLMLASHWIDRWVKRIPQDVHQPVLLMLAEHDRIVDNAQTRAYFESLASPDKQLIEYPGAHHTLEFEPDPSRYARDLIAWLDRVLKTEATVAT